MKPFFSLLNASFKEFVRDRMAMFWSLVFPIMFILIFGTVFSEQDSGGYPVGVVLQDKDDQAALGFFCTYEMADREDGGDPAISPDDLQLCGPWFQQAAGLRPPENAAAPTLPLYLHRGTLDQEMEKLRDGDRRAVIVFPAGLASRCARD